MEIMQNTHARLLAELNLFRIAAIPNHNYQPNGTKSYVSVLNRYNILPTKPGPYHRKTVTALYRKPGGGVSTNLAYLNEENEGLFKARDKKPAVRVAPEDQQNEAQYLCEISIGHPAQRALVHIDTGVSDF
jgi:hypothetical protein